MGSDCLKGRGSPFGGMKMFWNEMAVNVLNVTKGTSYVVCILPK